MGGGMPPKPPGPPGGLGAAGAPGAMAGNQAAGMGKLQAALKMMAESLPQLQIGSEISNAVLDALSKIGKHLGEGGMNGDSGNMLQNLAMMARDVKQQPGQAGALQSLMGGGAPPPGAGAPPPGAGGSPPMGA
jgi:hypothetical protein